MNIELMSEIIPKQRVIVNSILLVYWLPAVIYDLVRTKIYEYKIITGSLSNWGQILILLHLVISIWFDIIYFDEQTIQKSKNDYSLNRSYSRFKILKDQISHIAIDISILVSLNFVIFHLGIFKREITSENIQGNFNTLIILLISYSVSDIQIRISYVLPGLSVLCLYFVSSFLTFSDGSKLLNYHFATEQGEVLFISVIVILISVEFTIIHLVLYFTNVLKNEMSKTNNLSNEQDLFASKTPLCLTSKM